jgi:hypothetical protein
MKLTMEHASAEYSVSLYDTRKVVRDSSLEKLAVEKEEQTDKLKLKR